jgi:hypothetical protein
VRSHVTWRTGIAIAANICNETKCVLRILCDIRNSVSLTKTMPPSPLNQSQSLFDNSISIQNPSKTLNGGLNPDLVFRSSSFSSFGSGQTEVRTILFDSQSTEKPYSAKTAKLNPLVPDSNWEVKGVADFNKDGVGDLVWRNRNTGENAVWLMKNDQTGIALDKAYFLVSADSSWQMKGIGDFNKDGTQNILWQRSNGEAAIWEIDFNSASTTNTLSLDIAKTKFIKSTSADWSMAGWTDMSNDGVFDIVWQNTSTGENAIWELKADASGSDPFFSKSYLIQNTGANSGWGIQGVADFNSDGVGDLVWRNNQTNDVAVWNMGRTANNETQLVKGYLIDKPSSADWDITAIASTDNDPLPEIVWTNYSTGENAIWDMKLTNGDVSLNKGYFLPTSEDPTLRFGAIAYNSAN